MGLNTCPIFAICEPKQTKLIAHLKLHLHECPHLEMSFPTDDNLLHSKDIRDQVTKLAENAPKYLCFWATKFWEKGP